MDDDAKPATKDWNEAAAANEKSWDKEPDKVRDAPEPSIEEAMERTEEGYASGKEGVDPVKDDSGTTPVEPAG